MIQSPLRQLREKARDERARLATGEAPKPRFESRLQGTAARLLGIFFALMLALTLLSRAADGVTVPRVTAEGPKSGVLTQRVTGQGSIEPLGDLGITLPAGITVTGVDAEIGRRVQAGDVLLTLDQKGIEELLTQTREKLRILDLRLAAASSGTSSADTDAVLAAQRAVEEKQGELDRLTEKLARAQARTGEDSTAAFEAYEDSKEKYELAVEKAEKAAVKAADEAVKAAEEAFKSVKDSAENAIIDAELGVDAAEDSLSAENERQWEAADAVNAAQDRLNAAQAALDSLLASENPDPAAVAAAEEAVSAAKAALDGAQSVLDGLSGSGSAGNAVKRAKANLNRVTMQWDAKVKAAQEKLDEVKREQEAKKNAPDVSEDTSVLAAQGAVDAAEKALKTQARTAEDGVYSAEEQLDAARRAVEEARRGVEDAERKAATAARTDEQGKKQAEIERLGYLSERRVLQNTLDELERAAAAGGKLTAPVSGVVKTILEGPGKTQEGVQVAVLGRSDGGFQFSCKILQEEAEKLSVGDEGTLSYTYEGESHTAKVTLSGLGAADEKGLVEVTAELPEGNWPAEASASLEISKRSQKYESCLPLGALRMEGQDEYVLVVREVQTVMGTEQTVERVKIKVLAKDSERMAFTSDALQSGDLAVVTSSKPLEEGDRVRLGGEEK